MTTARPHDPRLDYNTRLEARRRTVEQYDRLDLRLAQVRLGLVALLLLTAALSLWRGAISAWWLLLPAAIFVIVAAIHDRVIQTKRQAAKAIVFYENGLSRIEDRWIGKGLSTEVFADDSHLYATDLDLFGEGSLFELLCTARTRSGQETLARWLLEPASRAEILDRQEAVEELRMRLDLREHLAVLGPEERSSRHPESLITWGAAPHVFSSVWPRLAAALSTAFVLAALAATLRSESDLALLALYGGLLEAAVLGLVYRKRVQRVLEHAEGPRKELLSLAHLLRRMEREQLASGKLVALRSAVDCVGLPPAHRIAQLDRLLELCEAKKVDLPAGLLFFWKWRLIIAPFSFLFWLTQIAFATESWRARYGPAITRWVQIAGEFDALCAIAGYAYEHPNDPFPEIVETGPLFEGEDLRHPLIPSARCVQNTVRLGRQMQLLVVSGSNMSGKSTLLRTVGINTVLALKQAQSPCTSHSTK